jgi:tRNA-2-methylthio-N6-dimethylallyladenosine synthase
MGQPFEICVEELVAQASACAHPAPLPVPAKTAAYASKEGAASSVPTRKNFYIETFGCQMNVHDSEKVSGVLMSRGYRSVNDPADADVVFFNTCSIREKAAQKVFSRLGLFNPANGPANASHGEAEGGSGFPPVRAKSDGEEHRLKACATERPERRRAVAYGGGKIIGVLGCVAQQEGEEIFERAPWVSLVCGSASYRKLPELLAQLESGNRRVLGLDTDTDETFETEMTRRDNPHRAYLTIIEGCDKSCAYCVVPFTRGPERSRASDVILREVRELADIGYSEIQLLGQTVNSYRDPARKLSFAQLLSAVAQVPGIRRVRFTTSHPSDFHRDIVEAIDADERICDHIHLPVQSGSTRLLERMRRTYTRDAYLEKIALIRAARRPISISTDIIVGFPGETEEDFQQTLTLLDAAQYDGVFSFKFSPRPNTPALKMEDALPEEEKGRRLAILQECQRAIQTARNEKLVGSRFEVLVENRGHKEGQWAGRTSSNRVVNFVSPHTNLMGEYLQVRITRAGPNSLVGEQVV